MDQLPPLPRRSSASRELQGELGEGELQECLLELQEACGGGEFECHYLCGKSPFQTEPSSFLGRNSVQALMGGPDGRLGSTGALPLITVEGFGAAMRSSKRWEISLLFLGFSGNGKGAAAFSELRGAAKLI